MKTISEQTLRKLFIKTLNDKSCDKNILIDILFNSSDIKYDLVYILDLLNSEKPELFNLNDFIKVEPESYHVDNVFNIDVLKDMGLMSDDNMVYGQIMGDDGWDGNFNPYKGKMKVDLFYHDEEKNFERKRYTLNTELLIKIDKSEIKYFNNK